MKIYPLVLLFALIICFYGSYVTAQVGPGKGIIAESTFDADDEGWTVSGDAQGGSVIPDYLAEGGNPDGYISAKDNVTGGVWYWKAPDLYLGDVSGAYGHTLTYQELAVKVGDPNAVRAVASANAQNPIWIMIPCHRVIGSDGSMRGYAWGIDRKKWLLNHESPSRQMSLFREEPTAWSDPESGH